MSKSRQVSRSAATGRFVTKAYARRVPGKTTTELVGGATSNARPVSRSAVTGRFISKGRGDVDPGMSIRQRV